MAADCGQLFFGGHDGVELFSGSRPVNDSHFVAAFLLPEPIPVPDEGVVAKI